MTPFERELLALMSEELLLADRVPEGFDSDAPLFASLGLDSIDALEIVMLLKRHYQVDFRPDDEANAVIFATLGSLAAHVERARPAPEASVVAAAIEPASLDPRQGILSQLKAALAEMFELAPEQVTESARLYEDLGLDSIDALDMVVRLQDIVGSRIPEHKLRDVRRVGDVIDVCLAFGEQQPAMALQAAR